MSGRQYSGIGGHMDFTASSTRSAGGRSLLCLPATAAPGGQAVSRIVGRMPEDRYVTTPRHEVDVVITEHGAAELAGRTVRERAEALIEVAAPEFRDALREEWERMNRREGAK